MKRYFDNLAGQGAECPAYSLLCFDNPLHALDFVQNGNGIDIAVLDIVMPGMTGVELAEELRKGGYTGYINFLTSINDFAAEAFNIRAFDYILKPVSMSALTKMMDRLLEDYRNSDSKIFAVKMKTKTQSIKYKELIYAEVKGNNVYFHLDRGRTVKAYAQLKDYADILLSDPRMIKANISYIINMDYVVDFENQAVVMRGGVIISVSGSIKDFKDRCNRRMFGGDWK